jgi:hypothetical protein
VVLPIIVIGSRRQEAFTFDDVIGMAQAIAAGRHVSTAPVLPKELRDLNYDQHRAIRWKDEYTLWRREDLPFQVRFFHPGYIFDRPIEIFYELANGAFERLRYSPDFFDFGGNAFRGRFPDTVGYAGFRIQQIATGFWLVIYGFLTTLLGGDAARIAHSLDEEPAGQETRPAHSHCLANFQRGRRSRLSRNRSHVDRS